MAGEGRLVESLGEDVGDVVVGVSLDELDRSFEHLIADEVVLGLDVLGAFVVNRVLGELDAPRVVLEDGQGLLALVFLLSEFAVRLDADVPVAQVVADADEPDGFFGCLTCRLVLSLAAGEGNAALESGRPADGAAPGVELSLIHI